MKQKIVIFGLGRMGITHASIIGGLYPDRFEFIVIEPNKLMGSIARSTLNLSVLNKLGNLDLKDSYVVVTSPPFFHSEIVDVCVSAGAKSIFVEKPFGLYDNRVICADNIRVGYVFRYNEVIQKLRKMVEADGCQRIKLVYNSNTLTSKPSGWRNGKYGGVLNEMGSHLIDLLFYITGRITFRITKYKSDSVISDVDDIVEIIGYVDDVEFSLHLNWVNIDSRKPVLTGELEINSQIIKFDQQSIDGGFEIAQVDYYVRGRDFSIQMEHFINNDMSICCSSDEANRVQDFIKFIKEK